MPANPFKPTSRTRNAQPETTPPAAQPAPEPLASDEPMSAPLDLAAVLDEGGLGDIARNLETSAQRLEQEAAAAGDAAKAALERRDAAGVAKALEAEASARERA